ncbi:Serine/threonine-protein kinase PknD [anaerobic digester metagenome]
MGSVWLAEDILLDSREIAIKLLPQKFLKDIDAVNRLKKEAMVSLQLSHPNLSAIRAFEVHNNIPYIVMDYVEGRTLSQYLLDNGKMSDFETFDIFEKLVNGVEYAHSKGIIHRDIKPSNIIISTSGNPVLLDFGISDETRLATGYNPQISGTLQYMSPEQLKGEPPHTSHDIYSLGATAFECIKGHPPFYKGNIIEQILHSAPPELGCECWFCCQIKFSIGKDVVLRPKHPTQIADGEKRRRSFIRWVLNKTELILGTTISNDQMAINRLEYAAETSLKELTKNINSEINLPYLFRGKHVAFSISRDDVRQLKW